MVWYKSIKKICIPPYSFNRILQCVTNANFHLLNRYGSFEICEFVILTILIPFIPHENRIKCHVRRSNNTIALGFNTNTMSIEYELFLKFYIAHTAIVHSIYLSSAFVHFICITYDTGKWV